MFARRVNLHLKPNSVAELTQRLEKEIIPRLRKEKGFQDEITEIHGNEFFSCIASDSLGGTIDIAQKLSPANENRRRHRLE